MTRRDWRAGELRFLLVALTVAVAALCSVGFFVDRMKSGMARDANALLAADLVLRADGPLDASWREKAEALRLATADTAVFPSMASSGGAGSVPATTGLVSMKAVSPSYPLRGQMKLFRGDDAVPSKGTPAPGTVWVDANLLAARSLTVGDAIKLGERSFRIAAAIAIEPDRGAAFMNFAPRVMLAASDLPSTGLVQFGSRITYRLLLSGPPEAITSYQHWAEERIAAQKLRGIQLESLESGRPEMRATLERGERFLSLVGLLSAMLAAVAIAIAARRYLLRHLDACAMMRCLGLTQSELTRMVLIEFLLVGVAGSLAGVLVGFGAHYLLLVWLGQLVSADLPAPGFAPALQGLAFGLLLLTGFALPPVLQLRGVPHNRVIRRETPPPRPATLATYGLGLAVFVLLLLWQARDLRLGLLTAGGFLGALVLFALVAWLGLRALRLLREASSHTAWRFALAALQRRPGATILQVVALSLGLMALLLLTVVRGQLIDAWRAATPPDAPNQFVLNIQTDQKPAFAALLARAGVTDAPLYPMVRGRLTRINDADITGESFIEDRAKRLVEREFNLSAVAALPPSNEVVAGKWLDDSKPQASVEIGLAKTLNIRVGDRLRFDVAGETVDAEVTSLRKLEWGSFRVNFFVLLNPALLTDLPQTWITAFRLPPGKEALIGEMVRDFPNLTVVDVGAVLRQIQGVVDQVVRAVEFLFLFTLASGVLVLYAALAGTHDERIREAGLLRALGATRRQLSRAQWLEFALVGSLSGFLAATGAAATGWALAQYVFDFPWHFSPLVWLAGMAVGAACALIGGWAGLRNVLRQPPLQTLRNA
ncbi:FtsX-like permease family protein [Noviherbaspirillum sp. DKR-6]|uniref:FtsX-like permease family protein n=2 Tax=Noviherbaspirillum pedocola TaxID=2801341 RepID=A0A934W736_9BURK|nr:FtsX-like permease family protein [Noviherbaspirillum pedocola]